MTAKQKAARAKFKAVVKEAQKLRKKNPKLTQAQAVKQAWAISYSKERSGKKLGAVKKSKYKVGDKVYRNYDSFKKSEPGKIIYVSYTAPYLYKLKLEDGFSNYLEENDISKKAKYKVSKMGAVKKKSATKVKAKKRKSTEMHTDTKSHNVNIRVVSGINSNTIDEIKRTNEYIEKWKKILFNLQEQKKVEKNYTNKRLLNTEIMKVKNAIKSMKVYMASLKKSIK